MKAFYLWLARLPLDKLYLLSDLTYYILYYLIGLRKKVVIDNLKHAFPEKTSAEITALSKASFRFACDTIFEAIKSMDISSEMLAERVHYTNVEVLQPCIDQHQSVLFLTIHQCNWEWLLQAAGDQVPFPVDAVYKPLHNRTMDGLMRDAREAHGAGLIPHKTAAKDILRKRHELRGFTMVADQSPSGSDKKYWQNFLNRPSAFYIGPQKIAELMKYPVFFVKMHRKKRGYYEASFELIASPPYEKGNFDILSSYIKTAEKTIREQPETFFWANNNWKRTPETSTNNVNMPEPVSAKHGRN